LIVFLSYKSLQHSVHFIDVQRNWRLGILRVESPIGIGITIVLHTLARTLTNLYGTIDNILTSTCSLVQLSILNDLTLEICVPSFRWREAHLIQRKIPSCKPDRYWAAWTPDLKISLTLQLAQPVEIVSLPSSKFLSIWIDLGFALHNPHIDHSQEQF